MNRLKYTNLIKLDPKYFFDADSTIPLKNGQIKIGKEQFLAVGFEKSKVAQNWEDTDYFNIIIVTKAEDQKYYIAKIEHPADILAPKYVNDDLRVIWVEENIVPEEQELISNLYSLNDSRCEYTITIQDKPYQFYEKYIVYTISVSYEIWEDCYKNTKISPYLMVRCKFDSQHGASALENTPTQILEYPISVYSLLQTSVFQYRPFEIWQGKVMINDLMVTLKSE